MAGGLREEPPPSHVGRAAAAHMFHAAASEIQLGAGLKLRHRTHLEDVGLQARWHRVAGQMAWGCRPDEIGLQARWHGVAG